LRTGAFAKSGKKQAQKWVQAGRGCHSRIWISIQQILSDGNRWSDTLYRSDFSRRESLGI
jgi:hypothetical protein